MPSPTTTTPAAETGFDPLVFWYRHKSKILLFVGLFVVALIAYGIFETVRNSRAAAAQALLASAQTADDYRKVVAEYPRSAPAGDAYLLLAQRLRAEGKYDE